MGIDTAVAIAAAAAAALAVLVVVARWSGARSQRRFEAVVRQLDQHMQAISRNLGLAVERLEAERGPASDDAWVTLDLHELLRRLVDEAARRTGAHAATVRVRGESGAQAVASVGTSDDGALLGAVPGPPDGRPVRALTLGWDYPSRAADAASFRSALVVPILEEGVETGALAAYARGTAAFGPEHARTLEALVAAAAPGITNARRFAETERRAVTDPVTGVRNRRGYEDELEREVSRARRTGRPLSVLLLALDGWRTSSDPPGSELVLQEVADLLERATRATDTVCRRADDEFAVILAETSLEDARRFEARQRESIAQTAFSGVGGGLQLSSSVVTWEQGESQAAFGRRVHAALEARDGFARLPIGPEPDGSDRRRAARPAAPALRPLGSHEDVLDRLALEVERAHARSLGLSLLLVDTVSDGAGSGDGRGHARVLREVVERLGESVPRDATSCRVAEHELAVILPRTTADAAATIFVDLREALHRRPLARADEVSLAAGITELTPDDDPQSVFGRAQQALLQARQAGPGTVVVATAGDTRRER